MTFQTQYLVSTEWFNDHIYYYAHMKLSILTTQKYTYNCMSLLGYTGADPGGAPGARAPPPDPRF